MTSKVLDDGSTWIDFRKLREIELGIAKVCFNGTCFLFSITTKVNLVDPFIIQLNSIYF